MDIRFIKKYAPILCFDQKEPFFPVIVGVTIFDKPSRSPSFNRDIKFYDPRISCVIEYAIYWDFDIQHLYELEHVWIYVDTDGGVFDCEASFHGKFLRGLKKDRSNILEETHVMLYSQPGKHAFSPIVELFELVPHFDKSTDAYAGEDGLVVTGVGQGRYETSDKINRMVKEYLQRFRFKPTMNFVQYDIPDNILVPWQTLFEEIPDRIQKMLTHIEQELKQSFT